MMIQEGKHDLSSDANSALGSIDISLEVLLQTKKMQQDGLPPERIGVSNFVDCYWTLAQLVTRHTVSGRLLFNDSHGRSAQSFENSWW